MLLQWNQQSKDWMLRAFEVHQFHKKLADILLQHIPADHRVADLGCGLGLVDLHLAPFVKSVTAIDQSPVSIASLESMVKDSSLKNLFALQGDAFHLENTWDTVLTVFFGKIGKNAKYLLSRANVQLVTVVHDNSKVDPKIHRVREKRTTLHTALQELHSQGFVFQSYPYSLEYGQPFLSLEDAYAFCKTYEKNPANMSLDEYVHKNVVKTPEEKYPYYLPYEKHLGIIVIERSKNEHL